MANLKSWLLHKAGVEAIEGVVILGARGYPYGGVPDIIDASFYKRVLSWAEAAPLLDYEFNDGYGSMDCHDVQAWTASRVIYIHEYDGSTSPRSLPRNPGVLS